MGNKPNILATVTCIGIGDWLQNVDIERRIERHNIRFYTVIGSRIVTGRIYSSIHIQSIRGKLGIYTYSAILISRNQTNTVNMGTSDIALNTDCK